MWVLCIGCVYCCWKVASTSSLQIISCAEEASAPILAKIHPSSALAGKRPGTVVFTSLVHTTQAYMRCNPQRKQIITDFFLQGSINRVESMAEGALAECDCESTEVNVTPACPHAFLIPRHVIVALSTETCTCATVRKNNSVKQQNHRKHVNERKREHNI